MMKRKIFGLVAVAVLSVSCIVGAQSSVTQHVAGGTIPISDSAPH